MEHRYAERFNVDIPVLLYQYNHPTALGRIKNATQFGFYIECKSNLFETLKPIQVEIHPLDYGEDIVRLHALIIHTQSRGLGVELETLHAREALNLKNLLRRYRELMCPVLANASKDKPIEEELVLDEELGMAAYQIAQSAQGTSHRPNL